MLTCVPVIMNLCLCFIRVDSLLLAKFIVFFIFVFNLLNVRMGEQCQDACFVGLGRCHFVVYY